MAEPYPLFGFLDAAPVEIHLPAAFGYTLRRYRDDAPDHRAALFLGRHRVVFGFRSTSGLVAFLRSGEFHDLAGMPDWETPAWDEVRLVADIGLTYERYEQLDVCRLDVLPAALRSTVSLTDLDGEERCYAVGPVVSAQSFPVGREFVQTYHVARELAGSVGLTELLDALAPDSPLGTFAADLESFHYSKSRDPRRLARHDVDALAERWLGISAQLASVVEFRD